MPIDPTAPGKLFAQIFAARQQREAERANLMSQLQARQEEGTAERAQQAATHEVDRAERARQFAASFGLQEKQLGLQTASAQTKEALDIGEAFEAGRIGPAEFEMGPGGLQPKGKFFKTSDGSVFSFRSTEEQDRRKQELLSKAQMAPLAARVASIPILRSVGVDDNRIEAFLVGQDFSTPGGIEGFAMKLGGAKYPKDPLKAMEFGASFLQDMVKARVDPDMQMVHRVNAAVAMETLRERRLRTSIAPYTQQVESILNTKHQDKFGEFQRTPRLEEAMFDQELQAEINAGRIPETFAVDGIPYSTMQYIRKDFDQRRLTRPPAGANAMNEQIAGIIADARTKGKAQPNAAPTAPIAPAAPRGITPPPF